MAQVDVSAIIISLNSRHFLKDCIESLQKAEWRDVSYEIIVVDNGSTDGTREMVRSDYPNVVLIANEHNAGYCRAGNQGGAAACGRYLLFLNDDILIIEDALPRLVEYMDEHPDAGMTGSRLLNIDGTDQFSSGRTYPTPMNALFGRKSLLTRLFPRAPWAKKYLLSHLVESDKPYEVDWLSAAAMMVRADVFHHIGGLAEDFYYFHEMVFCRRVQRSGFRIVLDPLSKIIHYEGAGSGIRTPRVRRRHIIAFHSAAIRWFCHHHGIAGSNPLRLIVSVVLWCRAGALLAMDLLRPPAAQDARQLQSGRPEGGVAI
ncbi:MAG: glycosyltransferase family 2 protein [Bryobacteraceae bacterium]